MYWYGTFIIVVNGSPWSYIIKNHVLLITAIQNKKQMTAVILDICIPLSIRQGWTIIRGLSIDFCTIYILMAQTLDKYDDVSCVDDDEHYIDQNT